MLTMWNVGEHGSFCTRRRLLGSAQYEEVTRAASDRRTEFTHALTLLFPANKKKYVTNMVTTTV